MDYRIFQHKEISQIEGQATFITQPARPTAKSRNHFNDFLGFEGENPSFFISSRRQKIIELI